MRPCRLCEGIDGGNGHAHAVTSDVASELGKLAWARDGVERAHTKPPTFSRRWFDAVGMDNATSRPDEIQAPLELVAPREGQHPIQTVWRESSEQIG